MQGGIIFGHPYSSGSVCNRRDKLDLSRLMTLFTVYLCSENKPNILRTGFPIPLIAEVSAPGQVREETKIQEYLQSSNPIQSIRKMNKGSFATHLGFSQHSIHPIMKLRKASGPESYRSCSFPCLQTENLQGAVSNLRALTLSLGSAFSPGLLFPSCFDIMDY